MTPRPRSALSLVGSRAGRIEVRRRFGTRLWPTLAYVGRAYRRTFARRVTVVAIVGSVGKTTTTRVVSGVLGLPVHRQALLNANSHEAMGRALLRIRPWQRRAVLEVGIGAPGEMRTQAATVRPQIVVVTAIASDHWASFHTLEATRDEKASILRSLPSKGIAILNADDPHVRWMATQTRARVVLAGQAEDAEIRATDVTLDWPRGMSFTLHADGEIHPMHVRLVGVHMVFPALAAIAVAREQGIPLNAAIEAVGAVEPVPGRMQPMVLPNGAVVLRDEFKGTNDTFASALATFETVPAERRIVVLGAIAEETGKADYRAAARRAAAFADRAIFVGSRKNFDAYRAGSLAGGMPRSHMEHVRHWGEAYALLSADLRPTDAVLLKGRWQQGLARIALALGGRDVQCRADPCPFKQMLCDVCPFLERPFDGITEANSA